MFIDQLGSIINDHPYISFIVISTGIEFLGKCLDQKLEKWNEKQESRKYFEKAILTIPSLQVYSSYLDQNTFNLYSNLRCGLVHSASPKYLITLSSKEELGHLVLENNRLNLKIEEFYRDFRLACEFVINEVYSPDNKIECPFLRIPDDDFYGEFPIDSNKNSFSATGSFE